MEERKVLGKSSSSYSPGLSVPAGRFIFVSGTVALDDHGQIVGPGDMEMQARKVFQEIQKVLSEAGASLKDVAKITAFVTDMTRYSEFTKVRKEVFGEGPYPSSIVEVKGLVKEGLLLEVEALAVK